jgi:UDP-3-O-[3-hydroxymyristoyl] glucosamine N-acyltransferase
MPDPTFFHRTGPYSSEQLAVHVGAQLVRSNSRASEVDDVSGLDEADERSICLFADIAYLQALRDTKAAAVVTTPTLASAVMCTMNVLLVDQPRLAFAMIQQLFYPQPALIAFISPRATVSDEAVIGAGCRIETGAVIEAHVRLGEGCHVGHNAVIGAGVSLGAGCSIGANVTLSHTRAGDRVQVFANAAIGRPGFGFVKTPRGLLRTPQLGRVVIGDDVEIGSGCTVDRGTLGDTRIGTGCKIDNGVQIAHNVTLGVGCILAGHVGIAGSATIGDFVVIGGGVVISDHVTVGAKVQIAIGSCVIRDVAAQTAVGGYPAVAVRQWHRQTVAVTRLTRQKGHSVAENKMPGPVMDRLHDNANAELRIAPGLRGLHQLLKLGGEAPAREPLPASVTTSQTD